jgi:hypothetical protein
MDDSKRLAGNRKWCLSVIQPQKASHKKAQKSQGNECLSGNECLLVH